jgi:hypothetical protein
MDPSRAMLVLWPTADGAKLVWGGVDATAITGFPIPSPL